MRYLSTADTLAAMPPLSEQIRVAEAALIAVVTEAEVPGKSSVHPRPASSIAYAMPASLTRPVAGIRAAFGMKWVTAFPDNPLAGFPAIGGLIILNDADTCVITTIIEASAITAARTAAVSGAVFARLVGDIRGRTTRVGLIGAGTQGRSHVPVLGHVAPGLELLIYDRNRARADQLAEMASGVAGIGSVAAVDTAQAAADGTDVLVTATSFGPVRQRLPRMPS